MDREKRDILLNYSNKESYNFIKIVVLGANDTKENPFKHPFIIKSRHYVTLSHWIGIHHAIELNLNHLEGAC